MSVYAMPIVNGSTAIGGAVLAGDASITLITGGAAALAHGSSYPFLTILIQTTTGKREIVNVTGAAGDVIAVTRAQEGTTALAFAVNDIAGQLVTQNAGTVTNVTASAPLASSGGATPNITLTSPLTVPNGGTGLATLTAHGILVGNGTGAVNLIGPGSSGNVLTSNGAGADPTMQPIPSNSNSIIGGSSGVGLVLADSTNYFFHPFGQGVSLQTAQDITLEFLIPKSGTLSNFYGQRQFISGSSRDDTYVVLLNGSVSALTFILSGSALTGNSGGTTLSVSAGDRISIRIACTVGSPSTCRTSWGLIYT